MTVAIIARPPLPAAPTGEAISHVKHPLVLGRPRHTIGSHFEDVGLLVLAAYLFPLGILLIGTPIALAVRVLVAIAHRL